jgi:hypothetical protein
MHQLLSPGKLNAAAMARARNERKFSASMSSMSRLARPRRISEQRSCLLSLFREWLNGPSCDLPIQSLSLYKENKND